MYYLLSVKMQNMQNWQHLENKYKNILKKRVKAILKLLQYSWNILTICINNMDQKQHLEKKL